MNLTGRCHEESTAAVAADPTLRLIKGWYHCPFWGRREHWWTVRTDGSIFDPTAAQFPSNGAGEYEEFGGDFPCEECGSYVPLAGAVVDPPHVFCSTACFARCVGLA